MKDFIFPRVLPKICAAQSREELLKHIGVDVVQMIETAQVFYVELDSAVGEEFTSMSAEKMLHDLSMPYAVCYVEQPDDRMFTGHFKGRRLFCSWAFFVEIDPERIAICMSAGDYNKKDDHRIMWIDLKFKDIHKLNKLDDFSAGYLLLAGMMLQAFCSRVHSAKSVGYEMIRSSIKCKIGKHKFTRRVGRVVHLKGTKMQGNFLGATRICEWSKSWFVRGHWRRKDGGIGKNRAGEYCVEGKTFVVNHKRGDLDLEPENRVYLGKL